MDCIQFEGMAHDLGRHRRLDGGVREEALVHAESCARCARLLVEVGRLDFALRSVAAEQRVGRDGEPGHSINKIERRIESALVSEFRAAKTVARGRSVRWQVAAVAAAAVMLVTTGWAWRHFAPGARVRLAGGESPAITQPNSAANTAAQGSALAVAESENGEQFIRLPYAGDGAAVENDAIVRAVLPRSALASLGFPVGGDLTASEPVPVELMVSEDGTPEAIRLVSQDVEE